MNIATTKTAITVDRAQGNFFFVYIAVICSAIGFLGFFSTFWMPVIAGNFHARPVVYIHGAVYFLWSLYLILQTWLAASGRIARHRAMGMIGISLITLMVIFGLMATLNQMKTAAALNMTEAGLSSSIVQVGSMLFFAVTITIGFAQTRRPDVHKRLMMLASLSILDAPMARWFMLLAPPGAVGPVPIPLTFGPGIIVVLLVLGIGLMDRRTTGRFHPVFLYGLIAYVLMRVASYPLSVTAEWHAIARAFMALAQ